MNARLKKLIVQLTVTKKVNHFTATIQAEAQCNCTSIS